MIILETERLVFRDHEPRDLESFCSIEADPEVRRFVGGQPRPREAAEKRFRRTFLMRDSSRLRLWAAISREDGRYVGYCGVYPHFRPGGPPVSGEGVLGFALAQEYWNRGLATEAAGAFVAFGFDELRLRRIVASVQAGNAASARILENLGFRLWRLERVDRRCFYHLELLNPSNGPGPIRSRPGRRRRRSGAGRRATRPAPCPPRA